MKIIMAPCDGVEWLISKWCSPSEECMRCMQVTYWTVLVVGGVIGIVATIVHL